MPPPQKLDLGARTEVRKTESRTSFDEDLHGTCSLDRPVAFAPSGRYCRAANPIARATPCHRVVRSNGDLAGYRWSIERKRELILKEAMA